MWNEVIKIRLRNILFRSEHKISEWNIWTLFSIIIYTNQFRGMKEVIISNNLSFLSWSESHRKVTLPWASLIKKCFPVFWPILQLFLFQLSQAFNESRALNNNFPLDLCSFWMKEIGRFKHVINHQLDFSPIVLFLLLM